VPIFKKKLPPRELVRVRIRVRATCQKSSSPVGRLGFGLGLELEPHVVGQLVSGVLS